MTRHQPRQRHGTAHVSYAMTQNPLILHTNLLVNKGAKLIEIDPERRHELCYRISAKANAMAGGVLEAVYSLINSNL